PNVGKSTLLNHFIGEKLAAVASKPQTTRQVIRGILTEPRGQIVFLDTPGVHIPKDALGARMLSAVQSAYQEADLIFWIVSPAPPGGEEKKILEDLKKFSKPIFLLVNKVDRTPKPTLLPVLDAYHKLYSFRSLYPISALRGDNLKELLDETFTLLPEGEHLFPDDLVSDQSERLIVSEMIREKVVQLTAEEMPYATAVEINEFKERSEELVFIDAVIYVERASQKKIVIGKNGALVKEIGSAARADIEHFLGKKVFLNIWVKERENWKKDEQFLNRLERQGEGM
ncbi:MAG: GTPase Era, partial [Candidatus Omnitrophica bacterium]|nr:GTPase Era [Candidatus Omnitrophota bacterium]